MKKQHHCGRQSANTAERGQNPSHAYLRRLMPCPSSRAPRRAAQEARAKINEPEWHGSEEDDGDNLDHLLQGEDVDKDQTYKPGKKDKESSTEPESDDDDTDDDDGVEDELVVRQGSRTSHRQAAEVTRNRLRSQAQLELQHVATRDADLLRDPGDSSNSGSELVLPRQRLTPPHKRGGERVRRRKLRASAAIKEDGDDSDDSDLADAAYIHSQRRARVLEDSDAESDGSATPKAARASEILATPSKAASLSTVGKADKADKADKAAEEESSDERSKYWKYHDLGSNLNKVNRLVPE
jgi:hypothetical protein